VYVTLGSTGDETKLIKVLVALREAGYQVLATTGGRVRGVPREIFSCDYAPGSTLLRRSQAVICHGGSLTVYQAINEGVPVVGLPTFHDQETNMDRVKALGWGVEVGPVRWNAGQLVEAVRTVTRERIQSQVRAGQKRLKRALAEFESEPLIGRVDRGKSSDISDRRNEARARCELHPALVVAQ
jgi:UDP:flavonoid glycosyltransferase YjiC (YdhE family)